MAARDNVVTALLLLCETAWLFGAFGVAGLAIGGVGSPLAWPAVAAVMGASLLTARAIGMVAMPALMAYGLQMAAGAIVVYLAVGAQASPEFSGVQLGWIAMLSPEETTDASRQFAIRAVLGSLAAVGLWWRGGNIGASSFPAEALGTSFKIGVVALAIAAVVDIFHAAELGIYPMMFVFFASGVAGLSIAHMSPAAREATASRAWTRVIGGIVGAVILAGLLFSLLQRDILSAIAAPLMVVLNLLARVVFYVIIYPLAYLVDFFVRGVVWLLRRVQAEPPQETALTSPDAISGLQALERGDGEPAALLLLQILQWSLVAAIVIGLLALLALAYGRRARSRAAANEGERESLREGADMGYDFANLLFNMLPARLRRRRRRTALRIPSGDANIADVFRIYFGLLMLGERRGVPKDAHQTPAEYQTTLAEIAQPGLARRATRAFMRACYGHAPATRQEIDAMRQDLEREADK